MIGADTDDRELMPCGCFLRVVNLYWRLASLREANERKICMESIRKLRLSGLGFYGFFFGFILSSRLNPLVNVIGGRFHYFSRFLVVFDLKKCL